MAQTVKILGDDYVGGHYACCDTITGQYKRVSMLDHPGLTIGDTITLSETSK